MTATVRRAVVLMSLALLASATAACDSLRPDLRTSLTIVIAEFQPLD
jgi:hypothetical protein